MGLVLSVSQRVSGPTASVGLVLGPHPVLLVQNLLEEGEESVFLSVTVICETLGFFFLSFPVYATYFPVRRFRIIAK